MFSAYEVDGKIKTTIEDIDVLINYVITGTNAPDEYYWFNPFTEELLYNSFGEQD